MCHYSLWMLPKSNWVKGQLILKGLFGILKFFQKNERTFIVLHRGAFCQFPFRWIYYCHSSKSTGKETGKTHLCALHWPEKLTLVFSLKLMILISDWIFILSFHVVCKFTNYNVWTAKHLRHCSYTECALSIAYLF